MSTQAILRRKNPVGGGAAYIRVKGVGNSNIAVACNLDSGGGKLVATKCEAGVPHAAKVDTHAPKLTGVYIAPR